LRRNERRRITAANPTITGQGSDTPSVYQPCLVSTRHVLTFSPVNGAVTVSAWIL